VFHCTCPLLLVAVAQVSLENHHARAVPAAHVICMHWMTCVGNVQKIRCDRRRRLPPRLVVVVVVVVVVVLKVLLVLVLMWVR